MLAPDSNNRRVVPTKQPWEAMRLTRLGNVSQIVQGGVGKSPIAGGDPGENRKPRGGTG